MPDNPIVSEVRKYRDERAAKFGYVLRDIAEDTMKCERQSDRQMISLARPRQTTRS